MSDDVSSAKRSSGFAKGRSYQGLFPEFVRGISWVYLKLSGWKVGSDWPDLSKAVVVAAPHTSNWDGFAMLAVAGWYRVKLNWMGKASLVKGPFGGLVRWAGCVPVERSKSLDVVVQMQSAFESRDRLILAIAPEGTRAANPDWKSGFYHIAHTANVPLVMAILDYKTKVLKVAGPLYTTGNYESDLATILTHYEHAEGRHPERFRMPGSEETPGTA